MYVVNVSKAYTNSIKKRNSKTKKSCYKLIFYDELGNWNIKRVSKIKAYWIKLFVKKHKVKKCFTCGQKYIGSCPNCVYIYES